MKLITRKRHVRKGAAVVETAVVAPVLILGMLGMIEVGYAFMVRQTVTLASREGCRAASLPGGDMTDVNDAVDASMGAANLTGYTTTSNIDSLSSTDLEAEVTVSIPIDRATFTGSLLGGSQFTISSTTTMRREGVDTEDDGSGVEPP